MSWRVWREGLAPLLRHSKGTVDKNKLGSNIYRSYFLKFCYAVKSCHLVKSWNQITSKATQHRCLVGNRLCHYIPLVSKPFVIGRMLMHSWNEDSRLVILKLHPFSSVDVAVLASQVLHTGCEKHQWGFPRHKSKVLCKTLWALWSIWCGFVLFFLN